LSDRGARISFLISKEKARREKAEAFRKNRKPDARTVSIGGRQRGLASERQKETKNVEFMAAPAKRRDVKKQIERRTASLEGGDHLHYLEPYRNPGKLKHLRLFPKKKCTEGKNLRSRSNRS